MTLRSRSVDLRRVPSSKDTRPKSTEPKKRILVPLVKRIPKGELQKYSKVSNVKQECLKKTLTGAKRKKRKPPQVSKSDVSDKSSVNAQSSGKPVSPKQSASMSPPLLPAIPLSPTHFPPIPLPPEPYIPTGHSSTYTSTTTDSTPILRRNFLPPRKWKVSGSWTDMRDQILPKPTSTVVSEMPAEPTSTRAQTSTKTSKAPDMTRPIILSDIVIPSSSIATISTQQSTLTDSINQLSQPKQTETIPGQAQKSTRPVILSNTIVPSSTSTAIQTRVQVWPTPIESKSLTRPHQPNATTSVSPQAQTSTELSIRRPFTPNVRGSEPGQTITQPVGFRVPMPNPMILAETQKSTQPTTPLSSAPKAMIPTHTVTSTLTSICTSTATITTQAQMLPRPLKLLDPCIRVLSPASTAPIQLEQQSPTRPSLSERSQSIEKQSIKNLIPNRPSSPALPMESLGRAREPNDQDIPMQPSSPLETWMIPCPPTPDALMNRSPTPTEMWVHTVGEYPGSSPNPASRRASHVESWVVKTQTNKRKKHKRNRTPVQKRRSRKKHGREFKTVSPTDFWTIVRKGPLSRTEIQGRKSLPNFQSWSNERTNIRSSSSPEPRMCTWIPARSVSASRQTWPRKYAGHRRTPSPSESDVTQEPTPTRPSSLSEPCSPTRVRTLTRSQLSSDSRSSTRKPMPSPSPPLVESMILRRQTSISQSEVRKKSKKKRKQASLQPPTESWRNSGAQDKSRKELKTLSPDLWTCIKKPSRSRSEIQGRISPSEEMQPWSIKRIPTRSSSFTKPRVCTWIPPRSPSPSREIRPRKCSPPHSPSTSESDVTRDPTPTRPSSLSDACSPTRVRTLTRLHLSSASRSTTREPMVSRSSSPAESDIIRRKTPIARARVPTEPWRNIRLRDKPGRILKTPSPADLWPHQKRPLSITDRTPPKEHQPYPNERITMRISMTPEPRAYTWISPRTPSLPKRKSSSHHRSPSPPDSDITQELTHTRSSSCSPTRVWTLSRLQSSSDSRSSTKELTPSRSSSPTDSITTMRETSISISVSEIESPEITPLQSPFPELPPSPEPSIFVSKLLSTPDRTMTQPLRLWSQTPPLPIGPWKPSTPLVPPSEPRLPIPSPGRKSRHRSSTRTLLPPTSPSVSRVLTNRTPPQLEPMKAPRRPPTPPHRRRLTQKTTPAESSSHLDQWMSTLPTAIRKPFTHPLSPSEESLPPPASPSLPSTPPPRRLVRERTPIIPSSPLDPWISTHSSAALKALRRTPSSERYTPELPPTWQFPTHSRLPRQTPDRSPSSPVPWRRTPPQSPSTDACSRTPTPTATWLSAWRSAPTPRPGRGPRSPSGTPPATPSISLPSLKGSPSSCASSPD